MSNKTKDLAFNLRPYEKCEKYGADVLSDAELLAVIIKSGTKGFSAIRLAEEILTLGSKEGNLNGLYGLSFNNLKSIKGIGKVKAIQILCLIELSKRISKSKAEQKLNFSNPQAIANYYMESLRHLEREHLILAMLNNKLQLIKDVVISSGTVNSSIISTREIFIEAIKYQAVYIVLLHNHPSGDPKPSRNDIESSKIVGDAGKIVGIELIDHIIIGDNTYISLKEKELI